jgi:hypothetical protein
MKDNLDMKICTNANGLDFRALAQLAQRRGITFEKILERAESGITDPEQLARPSLLPATKDWITIDDACRILCIQAGSWNSAIGQHPTARYWGVRAKSRSTKLTLGDKGQGARGCGILFYRPDVERIQRIKREAHISFTSALKVFYAMSEGKI